MKGRKEAGMSGMGSVVAWKEQGGEEEWSGRVVVIIVSLWDDRG